MCKDTDHEDFLKIVELISDKNFSKKIKDKNNRENKDNIINKQNKFVQFNKNYKENKDNRINKQNTFVQFNKQYKDNIIDKQNKLVPLNKQKNVYNEKKKIIDNINLPLLLSASQKTIGRDKANAISKIDKKFMPENISISDLNIKQLVKTNTKQSQKHVSSEDVESYFDRNMGNREISYTENLFNNFCRSNVKKRELKLKKNKLLIEKVEKKEYGVESILKKLTRKEIMESVNEFIIDMKEHPEKEYLKIKTNKDLVKANIAYMDEELKKKKLKKINFLKKKAKVQFN
jgi:hypothetical protein